VPQGVAPAYAELLHLGVQGGGFHAEERRCPPCSADAPLRLAQGVDDGSSFGIGQRWRGLFF
jgi:hypothetical protein